MYNWYKINKITSAIVLILSILFEITISVILFVASAYSSTLVWIPIGILVVGIPASVGIFTAWNMLNDWYAKSTNGKSLPTQVQYGAPMQPQQQFTYPQPPKAPQANMWQCPYCGTANDISTGFCLKCGRPRQ